MSGVDVAVIQFTRQKNVLVAITIVIASSERAESNRGHADDTSNLTLRQHGQYHQKTRGDGRPA